MMTRCVYCDGWYEAASAMGGAAYGLCPRCRDLHAAPLPSPDAVPLRVAVDAALADTMPISLRAALEQALLEGVSRASLLALVRQVTGGPGAVPGGLTYLQCHGWLYPEDDHVPL